MLEIIVTICVTVLAVTFHITRFLRNKHESDLALQREAILSDTRFADITAQVNSLSKQLLEEVGEVNRQINDMSSDFTERLSKVPDQSDVVARLEAVESLVSKHDLSLTVRRKQ